MVMGKTKKNGGLPARVGEKFHEEIEKIKDLKLSNGTARDRITTEKITNLITRHKYWKEIVSHLVEADQEEVDTYGL